MAEEYREFEAADYIKTEEDVRGLLRAAVDEDPGDGAVIRAALKHVARTQNMSALARDTGLNRGNLYEALSENGNPTLATLLKVTNALGLRLRIEPVGRPRARREPITTNSIEARFEWPLRISSMDGQRARDVEATVDTGAAYHDAAVRAGARAGHRAVGGRRLPARSRHAGRSLELSAGSFPQSGTELQRGPMVVFT